MSWNTTHLTSEQQSINQKTRHTVNYYNFFFYQFQILLFTLYFFGSISVLHKIGVGLDQKLAMPDVSRFYNISYLISITLNRAMWLATQSSSYQIYYMTNYLVGNTFVSIVNNMADFITPVSLQC
jgi:hypothetical protein